MTEPSSQPGRRGSHRPRVSFFTLTIGVLLLLPLIVVIFTSFNPGEYALFPPSGFSGRWFSAAVRNAAFRNSFWFSMRVALSSVALGLLVAVPAAVAMSRGAPRVRRVVGALSVAPLVVPEVLLALGLLILFNNQLPIGTGYYSIVAGHVLIGLPLAVQVSLAGLATNDPNTERAAWTLGASRLRAFWWVTVPAVLPAVASAAVFLFIFSFDNISISLFLTAPGQTTLPIQMYEYLQYRADPTVAAMSTILVGLGLLVAVVLGRLGRLQQIAGSGGGQR